MDTLNVIRSFSIKSQEDPKTGQVSNYLHMYSTYQGEYGTVVLSTAAFIDYFPGYSLMSKIVQDSGESDINLHEFRYQEVLYFLHILHLFNPSNNLNYGLQEKQTPPESQDF